MDEINGWRLANRVAAEANLPVLADVDVLVVGAGAAGVAAATTAAEAGCTVAIVERYGFAGGAAVAGMSATICGLYLASDAATPQQVVFGFAERFRAALHDRGGLTPPQRYGRTWANAHDPLVWKEVGDAVMEDAGVRILYHTAVTGVCIAERDGVEHVEGAVVASKAGQSIIHARRTIDASGDAAVVARAGYPFRFGDNGQVQNPTMIFRLGGVDTRLFWESYGSDTICDTTFSARLVAAREAGADLPRQHIWIFASPRQGELIVNATRLSHRSGRPLNVIDPEDFTEAEITGRRQVRAYARFLTAQPGCERSFVVDTGTEAGIRQTRSMVGTATISNDDVASARKRRDGICRSPWPIELHVGDRPKLHWLINDWCDVPYGALLPQVGEGLIVAGRCLSAEHEALASVRVTAQCFEFGHAAGQAAALSVRDDVSLRDVDVDELRTHMANAGSVL